MSLSTLEFDRLATLLREHSAIVLEPGKEYLAEARLGPLAGALGMPSITALLDAAGPRGDKETRRCVIEAMTTNETSFFRDGKPFEILRANVLPPLLEARAGRRRLDFWCAASSTGQEPYSLAMTLQEHVPALRGWEVRILATDIAEGVLAKAREGRYSDFEVRRGLPEALLAKYFQKDGHGWRIDERLRRMVEFRQLNLAGSWPQRPPVDVVFLRNVLIYFDPAVKSRILAGMARQLAPDGWLCLGAAETTMGLCDGFLRDESARAGWYRVRAAGR